LVAFEGIENSYEALDFGFDLAEEFGATVTVLNANESLARGFFN
jgi:Universal stress protein family